MLKIGDRIVLYEQTRYSIFEIYRTTSKFAYTKEYLTKDKKFRIEMDPSPPEEIKKAEEFLAQKKLKQEQRRKYMEELYADPKYQLIHKFSRLIDWEKLSLKQLKAIDGCLQK